MGASELYRQVIHSLEEARAAHQRRLERTTTKLGAAARKQCNSMRSALGLPVEAAADEGAAVAAPPQVQGAQGAAAPRVGGAALFTSPMLNFSLRLQCNVRDFTLPLPSLK